MYRLFVLAIFAFALPACTYNEEVAFIDCASCPEALDTQSVSVLKSSSSIASLDRRDWPVEVVVVPTRQVEHPPAFMRQINWYSGTREQRGEYPTAVTALDLGSDAGGAAGGGALYVMSFPVSWMYSTVDTFTDENGLSCVDRSPRGDESFERLPPLQWEYEKRWIEVGE